MCVSSAAAKIRRHRPFIEAIENKSFAVTQRILLEFSRRNMCHYFVLLLLRLCVCSAKMLKKRAKTPTSSQWAKYGKIVP